MTIAKEPERPWQMSPQLLVDLQGFSSCSVANAIETFGVRLRNEGFTTHLTARLHDRRPMVGHVVTARIACSSPPPAGHVYIERTAWWDYILSIPAPRVVVLQDIDGTQPGMGAFIGETHAHILRALDVAGLVTNGAVRDLDRLDEFSTTDKGFQVFSSAVSPSHAFAHLVTIVGPVNIDGLTMHPGDLIHGDRNGLVVVPRIVAAEIPAAIGRRRKQEQEIIDLCKSAKFSPRDLRDLLAREHPELPYGAGEVRP
jgi:regulator of RNase E activity RraA